MKLHGIYSEKIEHLPEHIRESIIKEAPHTRVQGPLPPELAFLGGTPSHYVDLGFENLGLTEAETRAIYVAFIGHGVAIPNTNYKLRYTKTGVAVVEQITAEEELVTLPEHWMEAVLVADESYEPCYIGKLVRREQY